MINVKAIVHQMLTIMDQSGGRSCGIRKQSRCGPYPDTCSDARLTPAVPLAFRRVQIADTRGDRAGFPHGVAAECILQMTSEGDSKRQAEEGHRWLRCNSWLTNPPKNWSLASFESC